jgi:membrane associated rhomboid family serine protease
MIALAFMWVVISSIGIMVPGGQIAHGSHLAGLITGILFGLFWRKKYGISKKIEEKVSKMISDGELEEWEDEYM